ncbi:hypothetical protein KFL_001160260 [Klebsormidium nitens]|uniref:Uncharacterized protein n=1 Tax=Klebsormidium nitens TaxID=105231 RepID=A0A1Y1HXV9_KLENI|nr:hypothetical protein KFL_001160260 [Klebsormidium nitens]|eukprot:GAQ82592.1 hypothetical protein KFL_001160260 [Klebsormidium nitens]
MVFLLLQIKADLENLTNLQQEDPSTFVYYFKVKCTSCNEPSDKESGLTAGEQYDIPGSRGTAHLVQKCKFCGRTGTITLVEGKGRPLTAEDSESQKEAPVACFDCRGMEPIEFFPREGWVAEGVESGKKFEVDLTELEHVDYDEKAKESVGVYNVEHSFKVTKG